MPPIPVPAATPYTPVAPAKKKPPANTGAPPVLAPPVVQPPTHKGSTSERAQFLKFIAAHPKLNGMQTAIWQASARFGGITALQIAAVILAESGGNPTATSKVGAYGLGQILDNTASPANAEGVPFFRPNHNISQKDKENPTFVANYIAWRIGGYMAANGASLDDAWRKGYGGDQPGNYVSKFLPKGYVGLGGPSAADTAGKSVDVAGAKAALTDPYVVGVTSSGKLKTQFASTPPKSAVMYDGAPITLSSWLSLSRQLESYFVSYTGGRPSNKVLLQYVNKGWSPYSLTVALANGKNFVNSPIYKKFIPGYKQAAKDVLAPGQSLDPKLVKSAIVNGWGADTLAAMLRAQPGYVNSNEFKSNAATLLNVHQSIMGVPDKAGINTVKQATAAGWTPDQYGAWLRSQPQYVQSPEYQTKTLNFLTTLGLITGQQPVLRKGTSPDAPMPGFGGELPTDKRLPAGALHPAEDTEATY